MPFSTKRKEHYVSDAFLFVPLSFPKYHRIVPYPQENEIGLLEKRTFNNLEEKEQ